jgi:hypothetical protein
VCWFDRPEFTPAIGKFVPAMGAFRKGSSCCGFGRPFCTLCAEGLMIEAFLDFARDLHTSTTLRAEEGAAR